MGWGLQAACWRTVSGAPGIAAGAFPLQPARGSSPVGPRRRLSWVLAAPPAGGALRPTSRRGRDGACAPEGSRRPTRLPGRSGREAAGVAAGSGAPLSPLSPLVSGARGWGPPAPVSLLRGHLGRSRAGAQAVSSRVGSGARRRDAQREPPVVSAGPAPAASPAGARGREGVGGPRAARGFPTGALRDGEGGVPSRGPALGFRSNN